MKRVIAGVFLALAILSNPAVKFIRNTMNHKAIPCSAYTTSQTVESKKEKSPLDFLTRLLPKGKSQTGTEKPVKEQPQLPEKRLDSSFEQPNDPPSRPIKLPAELGQEKTPRSEQIPSSGSYVEVSASARVNAYKAMNDFYIEFFEKNIAKRQVVTQYSKEDLQKLASEHGVDIYKMRVMLVIQAVYQMNGTNKDLKEVGKMSLTQMTKFIYEEKNKFFESITPEQRAQFEKEYKEYKQGKSR